MKLCSKCNRKLIEYGKKYCNECAEEADKEKKLRNREYDKNYRKNTEIYHDKRWVELTEECKRKFKGLDIYSYYVLGRIEFGELSHHIETVEECESRRFDISNLIYLSGSNHALIHSKYDKGNEIKKNMQELLFSLVLKWNREMMR